MQSGEGGFKKGVEELARKLRTDREMYEGAIKDLEENGGDKKVIEKLRSKLKTVDQVLNSVHIPNKEKGFFVSL